MELSFEDDAGSCTITKNLTTLGLTPGCCVSDDCSRAVVDRVAAVEATVADLASGVEGLTATVASLASSVAGLNSSYTNMQTEVSALGTWSAQYPTANSPAPAVVPAPTVAPTPTLSPAELEAAVQALNPYVWFRPSGLLSDKWNDDGSCNCAMTAPAGTNWPTLQTTDVDGERVP